MNKPNLSPPVLFISDAHLGGFSDAENARIESELIQLIHYCQHNEIRLAVLGDLFDYWMEFPDHIPSLGRRLLDHFETYNQQLGPTLYITGNHDNWTRGHLAERGFYVEPEHIELAIDKNKLLLLHGDGLSDKSFGLQRPLMHRLLRNSGFINLYQQILPPAVGLKCMQYFSRFNRWMDHYNDDGATLNKWAKRQLEHSEVNLIISGHDHIPRRKQFDFGSYINLGTFYKHRTMAFYNNSSVTLVFWDPGTQSFKPFDSTNINIDE